MTEQACFACGNAGGTMMYTYTYAGGRVELRVRIHDMQECRINGRQRAIEHMRSLEVYG